MYLHCRCRRWLSGTCFWKKWDRQKDRDKDQLLDRGVGGMYELLQWIHLTYYRKDGEPISDHCVLSSSLLTTCRSLAVVKSIRLCGRCSIREVLKILSSEERAYATEINYASGVGNASGPYVVYLPVKEWVHSNKCEAKHLLELPYIVVGKITLVENVGDMVCQRRLQVHKWWK